MMVFKFIIICLFISTCQCRVPDKVFCVNQECSGPISKAKTLLSYTSGDEDLISFRGNQEAIIYMKSAGTNPDLWYAEINGQSGFVNSKFLRENKVFEKHPQFVVPVEVKNKQKVQPDKVQQAHEVFEGTTIFPNEASSTTPEFIPTTAPTTEHVESSTPPAEIQKDLVHDINNNNLNNSPNDGNSHYEILLNQNNNDIKGTSDKQIIQNENQENTVQANIVTDIPPLASTTTQNLVENIDNSNSNDQLNNIVTQIKQEIPSQNPESLPPPQSITSGITENFVSSENVLEFPNIAENLPQSTENPNTADINELNASMPSNLINVENNVQPLPDIHSESNTQSQELYVPPPNYENIQIPPVPEVPVPVQNEHIVLNNQNNEENNNLQNINGVPIEDSPVAAPQLFDTFPPVFIETQTVSSTTEGVPFDVAQTIPASTETSYFASSESSPVPIHNSEGTINSPEQLSASQSNIVITSTENSATSSEDIISTVTTENPTTQSYEEVTQSTPYESTEQEYTESYLYSSTESNEDIDSTTKVPISEENTSDGFLSGVYSTLADIWPSSTEAPPPETIFNPEYMHKDELQAAEPSESFSFIPYIIAMYRSIAGSREESRALFATPGETCYKDEYCDGESTENKNRLLTFLVTTAVSVLLFTLGYYYIDNRRQDSRLIGTINSLQRDLLFSTKECEILKEELTSTKSKLAGIEDNSFGMDDMVLSLKEEINELKAQNERLRKSLDDNEKLLRVSENTASELQNTLSDVENTLSELFVERANTEEQIAELNGKVQAFEEELISVSRERDNYQLKYVSAESALEETKKQKKQLEELNKKLSEAQNTIELQRHEIVALKNVVKELKSGASSDVDVNSLIDHTEIKAKLSKATEEKDTYMTKFELEHKERVRLTQELAVTQESLQNTTQQATEALTRLEVLGKYFQERESELMKELSAKESLWLSKQGESASTIEKMDILQQEAQRYKEKCDALTLELAEQESMRRTAISEIEARAHTAWLEARQAKRDAEAAKEEAAALRRKLASMHQADGAASPHRPVASPLEMVDSSMLPPPMLPLSFMPPPILPPLPRPPPLGRLPSPRPSRYDRDYPAKRYTPLADFSPTSRDGLHSPVDFDYPPESEYIARSVESERDYDRRERDGRSTGCSTHERGSSWERDRDTEYHSDSPSRRRRPRRRYTRPDSGPSSASSHTESEDSGN